MLLLLEAELERKVRMDDKNLNNFEGPGNNRGQNGKPGGGNNDNSNQTPPKKTNLLLLLVSALVILLSVSYFMKIMTGQSSKEVSYNEFIGMVDAGEVESVLVDGDKITIFPKEKEGETITNIYGQKEQIIYYTGVLESGKL